jgi:hypothetical protein
MTMTDTTTADTNAEILRRFGPNPNKIDDLPEYQEFYDDWVEACTSILRTESDWCDYGYTYAWVDTVPDWVSLTDWEEPYFDGFDNPDEPGGRYLELELVGGGNVCVSQVFEKSPSWSDKATVCRQLRLQVQARMDCGTWSFSSGDVELSQGLRSSYLQASAIVFHGRVPQSVVDRVAETFRLVSHRLDNFRALLNKRIPHVDNFLPAAGSEEAKRLGRLRNHLLDIEWMDDINHVSA